MGGGGGDLNVPKGKRREDYFPRGDGSGRGHYLECRGPLPGSAAHALGQFLSLVAERKT